MRYSTTSVLATLLFAVALCFVSTDSSAQRSNQYPTTVSQQSAQDHYYQHATIVYHGPDGKTTSKAFKDLSPAERSNLPSHLPPSERAQVATLPQLPAGTEVHVSIRGRVMIVPAKK